MARALILLKRKLSLMKKINLPFVSAILASMVLLSSCQVIGGIFKAGVWVGVLMVVFIVALILYLVSRSGKK